MSAGRRGSECAHVADAAFPGRDDAGAGLRAAVQPAQHRRRVLPVPGDGHVARARLAARRRHAAGLAVFAGALHAPDALINLGFKPQLIEEFLQGLAETVTVEEGVRKALGQLSQL